MSLQRVEAYHEPSFAICHEPSHSEIAQLNEQSMQLELQEHKLQAQVQEKHKVSEMLVEAQHKISRLEEQRPSSSASEAEEVEVRAVAAQACATELVREDCICVGGLVE